MHKEKNDIKISLCSKITNNKSVKTQEDKFLLSFSNFRFRINTFFRENAGARYFVKSLEFHLIQADYRANAFKKFTV